MNNFLPSFYFILLLLILGACQNEVRNTDYMVVSTNEVKIEGSTQRGVKFSASILLESDESITEQGFTYALHNNPDLQDFVLKVNDINRSNFKIELNHTIQPDTTYYVRSFVRTDEHLIYGNEVSFYSNGSEPPHIETIEPALAFWGDTIMITGENFDHSGKNNSVWFNEFEATETWGSLDTLFVIVPDELNAKRSELKVSLYGQQSENSKTFEIHSPVIHSISRTEGQYPDTITVKGNYFSEDYGHLSFVEQELHAISITQEEMKFKVPYLGEAKNGPVKLEQLDEESLVVNQFQYNEQVIYGLNENGLYYGEPMVIKAENFDFRGIQLHLEVEGASLYSSRLKCYQDSLVFSMNDFYRYELQKENNYSLKLHEEQKEVYSGTFQFLQPYIELVQKQVSINGDLNLKIRGANFWYIECYYSGKKDTVLSANMYVDANGKYKTEVPYSFAPGEYQFYLEDYRLGNSNAVNFTIMEPEIVGIQPMRFDRMVADLELFGDYLPQHRYSTRQYFQLVNPENGNSFSLNLDSDNKFSPKSIVGNGWYNLVYEFGGIRKEIPNAVQFDDCFTYYEKINGLECRHDDQYAIKFDDQIVVYEMRKKAIINLTTKECEIKYHPYGSSNPYYNLKSLSIGNEIFILNRYGALYKLNKETLGWMKEENAEKQVPIRAMLNVEDVLWIIDENGVVYSKNNENYIQIGQIQNTSEIRFGVSKGQEIFIFGPYSVKIYNSESFKLIDDISHDFAESKFYMRSCVPMKNSVFIKSYNSFRLFDYSTRTFTQPAINKLPYYDPCIFNDENQDLYLLDCNRIYKYNDQ